MGAVNHLKTLIKEEDLLLAKFLVVREGLGLLELLSVVFCMLELFRGGLMSKVGIFMFVGLCGGFVGFALV